MQESVTALVEPSTIDARHFVPQAVQVESRLCTAELHRRLREFELDAAIGHFTAQDAAGLRVVALYEESYVVLASDDRLIPRNQVMRWADAAQLPLALLAPHTIFRHVIDEAFARSGFQPVPQIETDSIASRTLGLHFRGYFGGSVASSRRLLRRPSRAQSVNFAPRHVHILRHVRLRTPQVISADTGCLPIEQVTLEVLQTALNEIRLLYQNSRDLGLGVALAAPAAGYAGLVDPPNDGHLCVDIGKVIHGAVVGGRDRTARCRPVFRLTTMSNEPCEAVEG